MGTLVLTAAGGLVASQESNDFRGGIDSVTGLQIDLAAAALEDDAKLVTGLRLGQ